MGSLKIPKFSVGRMLWAVTLVAAGLSIMVKSGSKSAALFAAECTAIGACFGAAVGLIVDRPRLLTLIGAGLWVLFALFAVLA